MVVHTRDRPREGDAAVDDGVPPHQPSARLPGLRPGGRVLAADLLHEARALRPAHDGREGPQAQGGAARAARHARRRALHPLLALRAVLRRDHAAPASSGSSTAATTRRSGSSRASDLDNKYSGNVVDICPVGALTDRDFRFQVRVWYLDTDEVGLHRAARAAATSTSTSTAAARITPRAGAWPGSSRASTPTSTRGGCATTAATASTSSTTPTRLTMPQRGDGAAAYGASWDDAVADVAGRARAATRPTRSACSRRRRMSNEDLFALSACCERAASRSVAFRVPPATPGDEDDFLLRADKNPNTRGRRADRPRRRRRRACSPRRARAACAASGSSTTTCSPAAGRPPTSRAALERVETLIFTGTNANATSERAHSCCPPRRGSSATAPSRTSRAACSASAPRWSRSARRCPTGRCSAACSAAARRRRRPAHARRALVPRPRRRGARLRGHDLPDDRRRRAHDRGRDAGRRPCRRARRESGVTALWTSASPSAGWPSS